MEIRNYQDQDEQSWVRCRVLSFLDTPYYDDVHREKEKYDHPSIELVAIENKEVIGLIDIEFDTDDEKICSIESQKGGMIWHLAVHPDYQNRGVGQSLMEEADELAGKAGLDYLEAWTRDQGKSASWFERNDYTLEDEYYHLYLTDEDMAHNVEPEDDTLIPMYMFAHYTGDNIEQFEDIDRKYKCMCYIKTL